MKTAITARFGKALLALACLSPLAACTKNTADSAGVSRVYEMSESGNQALSDVSDFASAERYALQNGYYDGSFCSSYLKGGEKVYFSASYDDGEAGQAYGHLEADGGKFWFNQEGMPTSQAMFAPGLGAFEGRSLWEFKRYFHTICSVAFGKGRSGPDYTSIKAEKISMTGGTAGGEVAYQDALKLSLGKTSDGGKTDVVMVFVKGLGPRVVEFRETNMPAGTAKVYIDGAAGGALPASK